MEAEVLTLARRRITNFAKFFRCLKHSYLRASSSQSDSCSKATNARTHDTYSQGVACGTLFS